MNAFKFNLTSFLLPLITAGAFQVPAQSILNGGFEEGDTSGWTTLGDVSASGSVNYGENVINPYAGEFSARLVSSGADAATLAQTMGVSLETLNASGPGQPATNGSLLYQTVSAEAGESFQFRWNFVEQDYLPFDDWAFYGISLDGAPAELVRFASLGSVGPEDGTTISGWETFSVTIPQTGSYTFYFGAVNAVDEGLDSELWLDGIGVRAAIPEPSAALLGLGAAGMMLTRRRRAVPA